MTWQSWEPQFKSDFENCIFYNAILRNSVTFDDEDVNDLKNLHDLPNSVLEEYYIRSKKIISKMNELGLNRDPTWDEIDRVYLKDIKNQIKENKRHLLVDSIRDLLNTLELKYEV
jgi:hypothetical protein